MDKSGANLAALVALNAKWPTPIKGSAKQIPEQHRRAGTPRHQTHHQTDDGLQGFSLCTSSFVASNSHICSDKGKCKTMASPKLRPALLIATQPLSFGSAAWAAARQGDLVTAFRTIPDESPRLATHWQPDLLGVRDRIHQARKTICQQKSIRAPSRGGARASA